MGCAFKRSCNGAAGALQDVCAGSAGGVGSDAGGGVIAAAAAVIQSSCTGSGSNRVRRLYPGWAARHALTRATDSGPRWKSRFSGLASQFAWLARLLAALHATAVQ